MSRTFTKGANADVLVIDDLRTDCDPLKIKEFIQTVPERHEYERIEMGEGFYLLRCKRFGTFIFCTPREQDGALTRAYKEHIKEHGNG